MKTFLVFCIIVVVLVGGYVTFKKDNSFSFSFFSDRAASLGERAQEFVGNGDSVDTVKNQAKEAVSSVEEKGKETLDDISYSARETVYEKIKEAVLDPIQEKAKNLFGLSSDEPVRIERTVLSLVRFDDEETLGVGHVIKKDEPAYFDIKNPFFELSGTTPFTVSWKDGVMESGELGEGESVRVISHTWGKEGEYLVVVSFSHTDTDSIEQKVRVVVYD